MAQKILVVDDEPTIRKTFELVLTDAGYEVTTVENGTTAIAQARAMPFDLIFLDILLPDMHGSEVFRQLKALHPTPIVCIVTAITANDYTRVEDYVRLIELGAKDKFLRKPLSTEEILKATKELLPERAPEGGHG